jgi:hypothetical protein
MKFINWIDHTMFYVSVIMVCFISSIIMLPMFEIYDKEIWLYVSILSILFGFLIAFIWEYK